MVRDEIGREVVHGPVVEKQRRRHGTEAVLQRGSEAFDHDGVDAERGELLVGPEPARLHPSEPGDLAEEEVPGGSGQRAATRPGRMAHRGVGPRRTRGRGRGGEPVPYELLDPGPVSVDDDDLGRVHPQCRGQHRQPGAWRHRDHSLEGFDGPPVGVAQRHPAVGPQGPADGDGTPPAAARRHQLRAPDGEPAQCPARGGVVGLPRVAGVPGEGGEQREVPQRFVTGGLVQGARSRQLRRQHTRVGAGSLVDDVGVLIDTRQVQHISDRSESPVRLSHRPAYVVGAGHVALYVTDSPAARVPDAPHQVVDAGARRGPAEQDQTGSGPEGQFLRQAQGDPSPAARHQMDTAQGVGPGVEGKLGRCQRPHPPAVRVHSDLTQRRCGESEFTQGGLHGSGEADGGEGHRAEAAVLQGGDRAETAESVRRFGAALTDGDTRDRDGAAARPTDQRTNDRIHGVQAPLGAVRRDDDHLSGSLSFRVQPVPQPLPRGVVADGERRGVRGFGPPGHGTQDTRALRREETGEFGGGGVQHDQWAGSG